jgi:hypoxanthine phosphoribosyltransferase
VKPARVASDLARVLLTEDEILTRVAELAKKIEQDYAGLDLILVGVLGGAAMITADLARALERHIEIHWVAVSSYRSGVRSSGSIRPRKDLDADVTGRHVLVVDGIIDSGLTAAWLVSSVRSRGPASVAFLTLFRKPTARPADHVRYVGFDIPDGMIVGYGLDYAGRYRNLRCCAVLAPHVYGEAVPGEGAAASP